MNQIFQTSPRRMMEGKIIVKLLAAGKIEHALKIAAPKSLTNQDFPLRVR